MLEPTKKIEGLRPFTRFCMTIGEIPSSYLVSMTYEEQLLWLCNYLEKTVIPAVNNNGEAVTELQNLFIELTEYVDNYFKNLDVQEEINNKLDEMAEDGTLAEIITIYLNYTGIKGFNTISDLEESTVQNGNFVYCYGNETYNDGYGAFYKVREKTILDTIDGFNIVAITNDENIVAERMKMQEIIDLQNDVQDLEEGLENANTQIGNNKNEQKVINADLQAKADSTRITKLIRNRSSLGGEDSRGQTIPPITVNDIIYNENYIELYFLSPGHIYYNPYSRSFRVSFNF